MDGEFVSEMYSRFNKPEVRTDSQGKLRIYVPEGWQDVTPKQAHVSPLVVGTLTGLVDYCQKNVDGQDFSKCLVHVVNHTRVELRGALESEDKEFRRQTLLTASTDLVGNINFTFDSYMDAELFFIGLQAGFVQTQTREDILTLIASIRDSNVLETTDDGVSQMVNVAKGVIFVGQKAVPNPVTLQPFRTFREVEQPASQFVLRLQSAKEGQKPKCSLFTADGNSWKLEAVKRIAAYLREHLGATPIVIG